jgi:hypothetical protein
MVTPGRSVCAPTAAAFMVSQTTPERSWIMKARSTRLAVEALEDRSVPSTVAWADVNNDGLMDMAAITAPTTITVSLANLDGSYTVSATLTAPKGRLMEHVSAGDFDQDGDLDISAGSPTNSGKYYTWLGNGDGTFGPRDTERWNPPKWAWFSADS